MLRESEQIVINNIRGKNHWFCCSIPTLCIKQHIRGGTFEVLSHACFAYVGVIEIVPFPIYGVLALCCVVAEVDASGVVHHTHQIVHWVLD